MVKIRLISVVSVLMALLCLLPLALAQDEDLETLKKEIADQKARLDEESTRLEELEDRLDAVIAADDGAEEKKDTSGKKDTEADKSKPVDSSREPIMGVSARERLYGAFSNVGFAKSVPLFGSDWRFSFGGYVKMDVIHDFDGTGDEYQFITPAIPVQGAPGPQPGSYTRIHARETRFSFEMRNTRDGLPFNKAFLEMDFFDENNNAPRIRQAYLQWGNLLAGRTWTTLSQLDALPFLLDFATGDAVYFDRAVQVRWEQKLNENLSWAAAIEDWPSEAIANPFTLAGTPRANWPKFVLRGNYSWDRGKAYVGTSFAESRWDGTDGIEDVSALSWALVAGGRLYMDGAHRSYIGFGGSYGEGVSGNQSYFI